MIARVSPTPPGRARHRRGVSLLENAIALPFLLGLALGMVSMGQGVSQFQRLALLAREGARYAATHGADYQAASTPARGPLTAAEVIAGGITPRAKDFPAGSLTTTVQWKAASPSVGSQAVGSTVTVTVSYQYVGGFSLDVFRVGTIPMSSASTMMISY